MREDCKSRAEAFQHCKAPKSALLSLQGPQGLDNLLYSADADFSCFADLALTSPVEYYREGQGSLLQCVLTPADPYMPMPNKEIAAKVHEQVSISLPASGMAHMPTNPSVRDALPAAVNCSWWRAPWLWRCAF